MKGLLSISFFLLITVGCFAGKIKGELRTESNGFQWYNYEGKEAYTKEGVRLFPDIKASEIKYILPFNDKESGEGCFVVKLSKKENLYINGISTKGDYYNLYTANGILIKGNMLLFVERFGIGQSTNKTFYTIIATTPLHSASGNQFKPTISIINDNGTSLIYDIDQSNIIALLKDEKDEGLKNCSAFSCWTRAGKTCIITDSGEKKEWEGNWKLSLKGRLIYAKNENTDKQKIYTSNFSYLGDLEKNEDNLLFLKKDGAVGAINNSGDWIIKPSYTKIDILYSPESRYFKVCKNELFGLINAEGREVIPCSMESITKANSNFLKYKKSGFWGIVDYTGKIIIDADRKYTSISDYDISKGKFSFSMKNYYGECDNQGKELSKLRLALTANDIKNIGSYNSAVELMNGSTKYWKVTKGGRYGLTDAEGKLIVPTEMEALESAGAGYLRYKLNGFWGLMNYAGKIIIDTNRGYTSIGDFKSFNKRFAYTMYGYKGECDATGKQISKIKVEMPKQNTSVASSSSSSSSNSNSSSKSNSGNKTTTVVVEHHRDPIPVQEWQTCTNCWGEGKVMCGGACGGTGTYYVGNRLNICSSCNGSGKKICPYCSGQGGKNVTVYR